MTGTLHRIDTARQLPDRWDELATACFQRRAFLNHLEEHHPRQQRYWLLERNGVIVAGAIVYTAELELLGFLHIHRPTRVQIVGIPCPLSEPGLVGAPADWALLLERLVAQEKGLILTFAVPDSAPRIPKFVYSPNLPTVVFERRFTDFEHYVSSLSSPYRYRLRRVMARFKEVEENRLPCSAFDDEAHALYLQVLEHSESTKLFTLTREFFRGLPDGFTFTTHRRKGELLGWRICAVDLPRFYFFFTGFDYRHNAEFKTYFNLLVATLREGIAAGAERIDLGPTGETPKTRLGGCRAGKQLIVYHRNALVRGVFRASGRLLGHKSNDPELHVFRSDESSAAPAGDRPAA